MSESQWQKQVETALKSLGWWFSHNPPNVLVCPSCRTKIYRGIARGIPDLWAIREESMLYLELKDERSYPDPPQRTMLERISKVKHIITDWARPRDRDRVQDMLVYPERYVTSSMVNRE